VVLVKTGSIYSLSIPMHDPVASGLLRDQISKAGVNVEEFVVALKK
jgi:hypothetical protein